MTVVKLEAGAFIKEYNKRIISGINIALPILMEELKRLTPEDTGEMVSSYSITKAKYVGDSIVGIVDNSAKHAIYVEYGVQGKIFIYQKPKGNRGWYKGEGARTFARAIDNKREEVIQIIYNEINK